MTSPMPFTALTHLLLRLVVIGALSLAVAGAGVAADVEREAREIEAMLIAPCCFSQQVSVHQSPAADEVRADVRARLAAGETRQQILDAYVPGMASGSWPNRPPKDST